LTVRDRTGGREGNGDKTKQWGTWWYFTPEHSASDDENDEYDKALIQLKEQIRDHTDSRRKKITKLDMEREQAEKNVENAWQNWEMAKRLAEQERMKAHESRRNEEIGGGHTTITSVAQPLADRAISWGVFPYHI